MVEWNDMGSAEVTSTLLAAEEVSERFDALIDEAWRMTGSARDGSLLAQSPFHQAHALSLARKAGDWEQFPVANMMLRNELRAHPDRPLQNILQNQYRVGNMYFKHEYGYRHVDELTALIHPERWDEMYSLMEQDDRGNISQVLATARQRGWNRMHDRLLRRDDMDSYILRWKMAQYFEHNVRTNIPQRTASIVGLLALHGMQDKPLWMLDAGCSGNLGLTAMALPAGKFAYNPVSITETDPSGRSIVNEEAGQQFTALINRRDRLRGKLHIVEGIGIDIQEPMDPRSLRYHDLTDWMDGCFYMDERIYQPQRLWDAQLLARWHLPNIKYHQNDLVHFDHAAFQKAHPGFRPNVVSYITVGNQLREERSEQMFANMEPLMADDCIEVIEDFVHFVDNKPVYYSEWTKGTYETWFRNRAVSDEWQLAWKADSGRFENIQIGRAVLDLAEKAGIHVSYPQTAP